LLTTIGTLGVLTTGAVIRTNTGSFERFQYLKMPKTDGIH